MKQGKVWGETMPLLETPFCQIHRISIKSGATCSKHRHDHRWNAFYVIAGELKILAEKNDYQLTDETLLQSGEICTIPPTENHWFEAMTDVEALEIYYPSPCSSADIVRENHGEAPSPVE